jgi:hypothetical protein
MTATPGAANQAGSLITSFTTPDVDLGNTGDTVAGFIGSFQSATVIDPTTADGTYNPNAITASPQGGNAIVAWDWAGGSNAVYSVDTFSGGASMDLYVYLDPSPLEDPPGTPLPGGESTTYGILGTTGPLYQFANPDDAAGFGGDVVTPNGNTGIGWIFQKETQTSGLASLTLADFGPGGDSSGDVGATTPRDWIIITSIDLSGQSAGWYRLKLSYNSATGDAIGHFNGTDYPFTTATGLVGSHYIGYRESLTGVPLNLLRPPTFDSAP